MHNGLERSFLLTPLGVQSVTVTPSSLAGGNPATATVTLNMVTPTDITVSLANTNRAVSAPSSMLIKAGTSSNSVALTTVPVASVTTGTIVATYNGIAHSAPITIRPPVIKTLAFSPSSVKGGGTVLAGISLDGPVAVSTLVKLTSNNVAAVPTVSSFVLAPKAKTATFTVQTHPVKISTMVTISATMNGATKSATLVVTPTLVLVP